jgi:long-chain fatty acid transport protein
MLTRPRRGALRAASAALMLLAGAAPHARAAGFSIFEQGARGMGFAGAFTAVANDPSAIFHNAGGVGFLKGKNLYLGGTLVSPSFDFAGVDPFPGAGTTATSSGTVIPIPAIYYTHQFSERVVFGIGVDSPFGLRTEWANPDQFTGRFISQRADLKSLSINPTVAFKLADRLSLGVGFDWRVAKIELTRNVPANNPFTQEVSDVANVDLQSDWNSGFGFNLGVLAKPDDRWSVGLSYRYKVKVDFSGNAIFNQISTGNSQLDALVSATLPNGNTPLTTSITFPGIFSGGLAYRTDNWTFSGEADWFQWSTFNELALVFTSRPDLSQTIPEDYSSSWQFRIGIERRLNQAWAVRGGYYYDASPSPAASVGPILPDAKRNGFCGGGSWTNGSLRFDLAAWYVKGSQRSTEGVNRDNYNGTYKGSAFTLGASFGYGF